MPTPKAGYWTKTPPPRRVPSVTTINNRFQESEGLKQWAFQQGKAGKSHLYEEAQDAAEVGTVVHAMVEEDVRKGDVAAVLENSGLTDEQVIKANSAFNAYRAWSRNFGVKIIAQEVPLVCEEYMYGGTPDAIGFVGNELCLLDWKTSNSIYTNHLVQLAAYRHLWEVNNPDQPITGGFHLLRFAKEHGDFAHHYFPDLAEGWEQFKLFRQAYEIDKSLKKRAA